MNLRYLPIPLTIALIALSCEDHNVNDKCVSGSIVGDKCSVVAIQLDKNLYSAETWGKRDNNGNITEYRNVIGLLNLNSDLNQTGKQIYVIFREPTPEESDIACYLDLPGPPEPFYFVLGASDSKCPDIKSFINHYKN